MTHKKWTKFSVLLIGFFGYLGFSIVLPILGPMFLDETLSFLPQGTPANTRLILASFAVAMYPLGQFIGSPICGKLSDHYGRRRILIYTLVGITSMNLITALSVSKMILPLLYVSRFLGGIFEGNITIADAVMADISKTKIEKTKNFGLVIVSTNLGWVLGPILGGYLSDSTLISWFNFSMPFWFSAVAMSLNLITVLIFMDETNPQPSPKKLSRALFLNSNWKTIPPSLKWIFITNFIAFLGFCLFFSSFPLWLIKRYQAGPILIGNLMALTAVVFCFTPFIFTYLAKKLPHKTTAILARVGAALTILPIILIFPLNALWLTLIPFCFFAAISRGFSTIMVSDYANTSEQGKALGLNTSLFVLGTVIASLIMGVLITIWNPLPFCLAIILFIVSAILVRKTKPKQPES